jgi:cyclic pyranopterin phosphate synthase
MYDRFDRRIDYLRISITGACDLRCSYCLGAADAAPPPPSALDTSLILRTVAAAAELGIRKVRLTGGEPLLRADLPELIGGISETPGIEETGVTTNGTRLALLAGVLKRSGLDRINISLDTLDRERYRRLTGGDIGKVLAGIDAAIAAGFTGTKINMVIDPEAPGGEIEEMEEFCRRRGLHLQRIGRYSLREEKREHDGTDRPPKCASCNRLRITADGMVKPCLHSPREIPLDPLAPKASLIAAINAKPLRGGIAAARSLQTIGG